MGAEKCPVDSFQVVHDVKQGLHFFDGRRQNIDQSDSCGEFEVFKPSTGEVLCKCFSANKEFVNKIVEKAHKAQLEWAKLIPLERGKVLQRASEIINDHIEELAKAETTGNGKTLKESAADVTGAGTTFQFYGGIAPATLKGDYFDLQNGYISYTRYEPFGVVGCIGAWNYPFDITCRKTAPALAAGNAVIYKPSPWATNTAVILGEILKAAGLPDGLYNVLQGETETGEALCLNPLVRRVTFTGSVGGGCAVQKSCASNGIKPVTAELGGKSPYIVFEDSCPDQATDAAIRANFMTQGQCCTNATRVFVHESIMDKFQEVLLKKLEKMKVGDPFDENTKVGAVICGDHLERVEGFVERAVKEGAKLLRGGKRLHPEGFENGFYFDPAVMVNVKDDMEITKDEVFGSVMLLLPFKTEEEVIQRANDTSYGLAAGLHTNSLQRAHRVARQLEAGNVFINSFNMQQPFVPFGGYKNSGYGKENSEECLREFAQIKSVYLNVEGEIPHILN
ncbi:unnamed protein product [Bursaphelenchus okinawaensis]|uniref:Aldehyde dehydrogenase domain-containing protein n=1 Tax=Bursaphelenchus okinawaensis TaxID=465554 RepID=A0A811LJ68_9BILA|nr:unnamed protein product [Bursaphelenchus okinawaensis]CAG9124648.1 unnamed protein product [Bursaphelenchus okinawaensis]